MDETTETPAPLDTEKLAKTDKKVDCAASAIRATVDEARSKETFTTQEALNWGFSFLTYFHEYEAYYADIRQTNNESLPLAQQSPPSRETERAEKALIMATMKGDFTELKNFVRVNGSGFRDKSGESLNPKIEKIVDQIPDTGEPVPPLKPAWMDERFNPELNPSFPDES